MNVVDIYSKRQMRLRGEVPDVYQYETIPQELRVQIVHILNDAFGVPKYDRISRCWDPYSCSEAYEFIHKTLCRHYSTFALYGKSETYYHAVINFFLQTEDMDKAIDVIELSFQLIDPYVPKEYGVAVNISPDKAIDELNHWFREHGVGYQYEYSQIIRVDSQFIYSEVVKPALKILSDSMYQGANEEFLSAHTHYRSKRYKECMNDCLKSFESCLKAICDKWSWEYDKEKDSANRLIEIVFDNALIPTFMKSHFSALKSLLASGVPTVRNKLAGHGQGSQIVDVPDYIAAYALHLTASNILLLTSANAEK